MEQGTRHPSPEAGFTLIEALVATVILSVGLIAVANLFVVATASNSIGNLTTATTTEATEVMERLKAVPFNTLFAAAGGGATVGSLTADLPGANATSSVIVGGVLQFNCRETLPGIGVVVSRWTLSRPDLATQDMLFITVRSESQARLGRPARAEFTTFRTCTSTGCPGIP